MCKVSKVHNEHETFALTANISTDFRNLSHRAAQRQSTFALTPSVATTSTVWAKGYAAGAKGCAAGARAQRAEKYWVAEETFLSFFQADNAGSALSSSREPRARARRRRALTEQQQQHPLPALRHAAASSTRTFDQDWELFKTKASSYVPSTRASSHASLDKNDKSNAKIDTHLTPGLILTVFDLCLPVNKFIPVSGVIQTCATWMQQNSWIKKKNSWNGRI
mgnify:CR=1 FL=1